MKNIKRYLTAPVLCLALAVSGLIHSNSEAAEGSADMSQPVKVFILLGQSNMVGAGKVNGAQEFTLETAVKQGLYPYLKGEDSKFAQRDDVRYTNIVGNSDLSEKDVPGLIKRTNWIGIPASWDKWSRAKIGPEMGIGFMLGEAIDAPVYVLKSCIGNRSLGWDLLSPSSGPFEHAGKTFPGYNEIPKTIGSGSHPDEAKWYAGIQWDRDIGNAKLALENLEAIYPGANGYEVAGFFFWQGTKDGNEAFSTHYERHLVNFIKDLRKEFNAPEAKFVLATLGQSKLDDEGEYIHDDFKNEKFPPQINANSERIINAQMSVDGQSGKYPEFEGNVTCVYAYPLSLGGSSASHYDRNAQSYMNVGEAMGRAMVELLKK
ncbi:MAG: sialate O-acetylesterase [Opitutales bacterium]